MAPQGMAARGSQCHLSWSPWQELDRSHLHVICMCRQKWVFLSPSGDGACPDALISAASRDTETGKGWRHVALCFLKIWVTESQGSPKSGILGAMVPRNLGTRGSTAPLHLKLRWTWTTTPGPDTTQNPDHEVPRPLPTPEPPPGAPNPGAVPGSHRPLFVIGRRHLGERRSACSSLWFSRPLQRATNEESGGQSGPRGSSSLHFRLHVRLRRPFPWGPRWRRRVSARGGDTTGTHREPRVRDRRHPEGFGRIGGATAGAGRGQRQGERAARGGPGGYAVVAVRRGGVTRTLEGQRLILNPHIQLIPPSHF